MMKFTPTLLIKLLFVACFSTSNLNAQDTIVVDPGLGTLQTAINQHGGDVIYLLEAGAHYQLDGIVNAIPQVLGGSGKTLTIVGEETDGIPALIQVGRTRQGAPENSMFNCSANMTLRNLFLTGKDSEGAFSENIITMNASIRVVVDRCVIDPAGTRRTFNGGDAANGSSLYLTNSQIYRNGSMATPNDGGWTAGMSWDTLWVENNTLVSSGQDFIGGSFHREPNNQFIWINHNTIMWHDVWIKKSFNDQNFYFTNNLLHDQSIFPELPRWYPFFPDFEQGNTLLCQTAIDTLEVGGVPETLPSQRRMFWEYNLMYCSPELQELPKYAADNGKEFTYLLPMLWDEDVPLSYTGGIEVVSPEDSCRENRILADKVNWPHMKYNHNWYDLDPLYNDTMIYAINDSVGEHILGFYRGQFWNEPDAPAVDALPSYNWDIDGYNGHNPDDLPSVWPRFDGSYTNPVLLKASLEGLPLGDLNWYPEQKFQWVVNQEMIKAHILDLNEDSYMLKHPDSISYEVNFTVVDEDGNPIEGALMILEGDTLETANSFGEIEFDTLSGTYSYILKAHAYEEITGEFTIDYSSFSRTISMRNAVGFKTFTKADLNVRLYPNPVTDLLYLEGENLAGARIQILNLLGSVQSEELHPGGTVSLDVTGLVEGIYLICITKNNQKFLGRITIQR